MGFHASEFYFYLKTWHIIWEVLLLTRFAISGCTVYCQIFYEDNKRPALFADLSLGIGESAALWFTTEIDPLWKSIYTIFVISESLWINHSSNACLPFHWLAIFAISDDHFRSCEFFSVTRTRRTSTSRRALPRRRAQSSPNVQTSSRHSTFLWLSRSVAYQRCLTTFVTYRWQGDNVCHRHRIRLMLWSVAPWFACSA